MLYGIARVFINRVRYLACLPFYWLGELAGMFGAYDMWSTFVEISVHISECRTIEEAWNNE